MSFPRRLDRSGSSLIEVLVTFVVFLVGMVSVVRLFPGGFLSMRHTENTTLANRLAQTEIERWEGKTKNLPSGILPWGKLNVPDTTYTVLPDVDPSNMGDPLLPGGYYFSDVNKFRRINSEVTIIPVPSAANWEAGSIYILAFNPIAYDPSDSESIVVYGGEMKRVPLPDNPADLHLTRSSEYAIDYANAEIYVKPFSEYDRYFSITYSYWQDSGPMNLIPVVDYSITVFAATPAQMADGYQVVSLGTFPAGFPGIDQGSDSLHRRFNKLTLAALWSDPSQPDEFDPYQFKMLDSVSGVIAFNPHGYGYQELTARGKEPLIAHIDYTVLDWHIIREERKLPDTFDSAADQDVKLTLRFIKKSGETMEEDGATYMGLATEPPYSAVGAPLLPFDVIAVDMETSAVYHEQRDPATDPLVFTINYKEGIIRFDPDFVETHLNDPNKDDPKNRLTSQFEGKTFRIYYRAEGDWALQAFKAYDVYSRSYGSFSDVPLNYQQYHFDDTAGIMHFPRCYAGCTVAVDYSYTLNDNKPDHFVVGDAYQISDDIDSTGYCSIDLLAKLQKVHGSNIGFKNIQKVYGVSIGTRVIWHETGRRLHAGTWRKASLQTYLTRVSGGS